MTYIQQTIQQLTAGLPEQVRLVAVSKYHPASCIEEAYAAGQRIFGESHVQEMVAKHELLPTDIEWHFIGHLQTNKVKYIAPFVSLIHAVDSIRLLQEIEKQAAKYERTIPCLLQLHVAREETKFGFSFEECRSLLESGEWKQWKHIQLRGLMCMASNTDDEKQIRREFASVNTFFQEMKQKVVPSFHELSMGMSHDYPLAIAEGSTLIRVGSMIFGERVY